MLTISWDKVDKFLLILVITLILMTTMVIFAFRGIFSAYFTAYEIDQRKLGKGEQIDKNSLDEAYNFASAKETIPLEIR